MNNIIQNYFCGSYNNYFSEQEADFSSQALRVAKVALPFISLYSPFGKIIGCSFGVSKAYTSIKECFSSESYEKILLSSLNATIAISAVAGTIFFHPMGKVIITLNKLGVSFIEVYQTISHGEFLKTTKQIIHIASYTLYLMMIVHGSLELQIVSMAAQVLVLVVSSIGEFKKGNWLEASGHLLMTAIRVNRLNFKVNLLTQKWAIEEKIRSIFVGELHGKWQFPSDHLPVGIEINGIKVISWNVMNTAYMDWVSVKDSQGLNGSMITDLNVAINEDGLTKRDQREIDMILKMMDPSTGIIALQECGQPFISALEKLLPEEWHMIKSEDGICKDQDLTLYNQSKLSYSSLESEISHDGYLCNPGRTIQNLLFESEGESIRIFNSHLPGDPLLPGRDEFASYVKNHYSPEEVTIALGDMNFERGEMKNAFQKVGFKDFALYSPWQTNIDPYTKNSKAVDHLFVMGDCISRELRAKEIVAEEYHLQETIELLRGQIESAVVET